MNTLQVQLKISLSEQLKDLLESKAARLGVPITQFVKHLIIKEVEDEEYPTFQMSKRSEKRLKEAMKQIDHAVKVDDVREYFRKL
ncbi:MAG: hypothetical protein AAB600_04215 [Patescibacteria group bacterium]